MTAREILEKHDDALYMYDKLKAMEEYAKQEVLSALKYAQYQSIRNPEQLFKMYLESKEK